MNELPEMPPADEQALLRHYREHSAMQPSAALDERILAAAYAAVAVAPEPPVAAVSFWRGVHSRWSGLFQPRRWPVALASLAVLGLGLGVSLRTLEHSRGSYDQAPLDAPAALTESAAPQKPAALQPVPAPVLMAESVAPPAPAPMADAAVLQEAPQALGGALARSESKAKSLEPPAAAPAVRAMAPAAAAPAETADPAGNVAEVIDAERAERRAAAPLASSSAALAKEEAPSDPASAATPQALQEALEKVLALRRAGQSREAQAALEALQKAYPQRDLVKELAALEALP